MIVHRGVIKVLHIQLSRPVEEGGNISFSYCGKMRSKFEFANFYSYQLPADIKWFTSGKNDTIMKTQALDKYYTFILPKFILSCQNYMLYNNVWKCAPIIVTQFSAYKHTSACTKHYSLSVSELLSLPCLPLLSFTVTVRK